MLFGVPQYIDVEDKIAGPLTARQFLWMLGLGALLIVMWNIFDRVAFYVIAVPVCMVFAAFAFYRPHGVPLIAFIGYGLTFLLQPKVYVWRRPQENFYSKRRARQKETFKERFYKESSSVSPNDFAALADVLDSEGLHKNERAMKILSRTKSVKKRR